MGYGAHKDACWCFKTMFLWPVCRQFRSESVAHGVCVVWPCARPLRSRSKGGQRGSEACRNVIPCFSALVGIVTAFQTIDETCFGFGTMLRCGLGLRCVPRAGHQASPFCVRMCRTPLELC